MLFNPPSGSTDPNAGYVGKNVVAGTQGSKVPPQAVEYPQREIVAVIQAASLVPTNSDLTQLLQAIVAISSAKSGTVLDGRNVTGRNRVIFQTAGSATWTVPAGITRIFVRIWGGGGGGSGNNNAAGASGGYSEGIFAVTPGQVIPITVGAGGAGTVGSANGASNPGGNGATSSCGALIAATGGTGGQAGSTAPGIGSGGQINIAGNPGQDLDGTNPYAFGGAAGGGGGGSSPYVGAFPGGGGGASGTANGSNPSIGNAGQNGSQGAVIIEY